MPESLSRFDVDSVRSQFPALSRTENGRPVAYLDGPGGTQVPQRVVDAMTQVMSRGISNLGGDFASSRYAEEVTHRARAAMADFFNADPSEIAFGQNMTSITFALSRALSLQWGPDEAIVLTSLDHDANFTPWARAAEDRGVEVRVAEFDTDTGRLEPDSIADLLDDRVRLVATCVASNAIGTLVDVTAITSLAHEVGALVYLDAVHAGPHHLIDVAGIGCDFLVASSYKFFGPHTGILYGKLDLLAELEVYKVRPAPSDPPDKLETGTQSFESIAGVTAAVDYLADLGIGNGRRARLESGYGLIHCHELELSQRFLKGSPACPASASTGFPRQTEDGLRPSPSPSKAKTLGRRLHGWASWGSTCGPAIITRSTPWSVSASSIEAAWFGSASSTTTPTTR